MNTSDDRRSMTPSKSDNQLSNSTNQKVISIETRNMFASSSEDGFSRVESLSTLPSLSTTTVDTRQEATKKRTLNLIPSDSSTSSCEHDDERHIKDSASKKQRMQSLDHINNYSHLIVQHDYHDHANDPIITFCGVSSGGCSSSSSSSTESVTCSTDNGGAKKKDSPEIEAASNEASPLILNLNRGGVAIPFPIKLFDFLLNAEAEGYDSIVSWQPHGRCFVVHKPVQFKELLPQFFKLSKIASFQRQLNLYGFIRLTKGNDKSGYYHERFLRGRIDLAYTIHRVKVKGTGVRGKSNPDQEPDFWNMPWVVVDTTKTKSSIIHSIPTEKQASGSSTTGAKVESSADEKPKKKKKKYYPKKKSVIIDTSVVKIPCVPLPSPSTAVVSTSSTSLQEEQQQQSRSYLHDVVSKALHVTAKPGVTAPPTPPRSGNLTRTDSLIPLDAQTSAKTVSTTSSPRTRAVTSNASVPPATLSASSSSSSIMVMVEVDTSLLQPDFASPIKCSSSNNVVSAADDDDDDDVIIEGWGGPFHVLNKIEDDDDGSMHDVLSLDDDFKQPLTIWSSLSSTFSPVPPQAHNRHLSSTSFFQHRPISAHPILFRPELSKQLNSSSRMMIKPNGLADPSSSSVDYRHHDPERTIVSKVGSSDEEQQNLFAIFSADLQHQENEIPLLIDNKEFEALLQDVTGSEYGYSYVTNGDVDADFVAMLKKVVE